MERVDGGSSDSLPESGGFEGATLSKSGGELLDGLPNRYGSARTGT